MPLLFLSIYALLLWWSKRVLFIQCSTFTK